MIKKCQICKEGEIDYSMSEIYLIPETNPQEAGFEGLCSKCSSHFYFKFKLYQVDITIFNDFMEEKDKKTILIS
jgi:hypothetical protein